MEERLDIREHDAALAAVLGKVVRHALGHAERSEEMRHLLVDPDIAVARVGLALLAHDDVMVAKAQLDRRHEPAGPGPDDERMAPGDVAVDRGCDEALAM